MESKWLDTMLNEEFYSNCEVHGRQKFYYCVDCCVSFCEFCLYSHQPHRHLRVRQMSARDSILSSDLNKLRVDCSDIKRYKYPSAKDKLICIRPAKPNRPKQKINLNHSHCIWGLKMESPFHFCSLSCKFNGNGNFQFAFNPFASNAEAGGSSGSNSSNKDKKKKKKIFGMPWF